MSVENFIGQKKILDRIRNIDIDNLPKSLLLLGEPGSGRRSIIDIISNKLGLSIIDITENISLSLLNEINIKPIPCIYLINGAYLNIQKENVLLKFLEEPSVNCYIIIIGESKKQFLSTIINRCQIWELEPYSKEELFFFTKDDNILSIASTPGQIINLQNQNFEDLLNLCYTIIDKLCNANISNSLSIDKKIKFSDKDNTGFELDCFIRCLSNLIVSRLEVIDSNDSLLYNRLKSYYFITNEFYNNRYLNQVNKKLLFDSFLLSMKMVG